MWPGRSNAGLPEATPTMPAARPPPRSPRRYMMHRAWRVAAATTRAAEQEAAGAARDERSSWLGSAADPLLELARPAIHAGRIHFRAEREASLVEGAQELTQLRQRPPRSPLGQHGKACLGFDRCPG